MSTKSIGTYWITLYANDTNIIYFHSFGAEHIPEEIKKLIGNKNIITDIYRIQAYDSIMCEYFCTGFIDLLKLKACQTIQVYFLLTNMKRVIEQY